MDGTKRCPQCFRVPELRIDTNNMYWLSCTQHGHEAMGSTQKAAINHWNHYIAFFVFDSAMSAYYRCSQ